MPKGKVVGLKPYSFKNDKGELVEGTKVFVSTPITVNGGLGFETEWFNLSKDREKKVLEGAGSIMECLDDTIYYGKSTQGSIDRIEVL